MDPTNHLSPLIQGSLGEVFFQFVIVNFVAIPDIGFCVREELVGAHPTQEVLAHALRATVRNIGLIIIFTRYFNS